MGGNFSINTIPQEIAEIEHIRLVLNKKIDELTHKYSTLQSLKESKPLDKPQYKIIWHKTESANSLYSLHNILVGHPLIERIEYNEFNLCIAVKGRMTSEVFNGNMIILPKMQESLICLVEAIRMTGIMSKNQRTHIILPNLFRKKNEKPFSARSIINPANSFKCKVESMMSPTKTMNECIVEVLSKKFTENIPDLKTIFGK